MVSKFLHLPGVIVLSLSGSVAAMDIEEDLMETILSSNVVLEGRVTEVDCDQFRSDRYTCDFYIEADEVIVNFANKKGEYGGRREADFKVRMRDLGEIPSNPYVHFFSEIGGHLADGVSAYMFLVCKTETLGSYCALSGEEGVYILSADAPGLSSYLSSVVPGSWPMCISQWDNDIYRSMLLDIREISSSREEVVTVTDFLEHGRSLVPYLILLMSEDGKVLPNIVRFENPEDAFESHAQYSFVYIAELVEALLYRYADRRVSTLQGTLQSEEERDHAVNAWRYWWNQANCPELNQAHISRLVSQE